MFLNKILRTCPRCHKRLYHFLEHRSIPKFIKGVTRSLNQPEAVCANCGHRWNVRGK